MDVYIVDALRTPRTRAGKGKFAQTPPILLLKSLLACLRERNPAAITAEDFLMGCVTAVGVQGGNLAKTALLYADWPRSTAGITVNRYCCSGLDAFNQAAALVHTGANECLLAGGVESLSQVPMFSDKGPWYSDPAVSEKTSFVHMGVAADLVASLHGLRREEVDAFALESHRRALHAEASNRFRYRTTVTNSQGEQVSKDEAPRALEAAAVADMVPVFENIEDGKYDAVCIQHFPALQTITHVHTQASSPAQVDGASLLLLANADTLKRNAWQPLAKVIGFASASTHPVEMLAGHVLAAEKLLKRAGLAVAEIDIFEINESFAASVLHFQRYFNIDSEKMNIHGGAISLGHPLGATGGMLLGMALESLAAKDGRYALVAIPGGAGVGVATLIERCE